MNTNWQPTPQDIVDDIIVAFWGRVYGTLAEVGEVVARRYDLTADELAELVEKHYAVSD